MLLRLRSIRYAFSIAVALAAASAGDALVEGLSNSHLLWHGRFTDGSSADLGPVSSIASLAVIATLALLVARLLREGRITLRALAYEASRTLALSSVARLLPGIYALQLALLFAMETAEQYVVYGHVLGGGLWLGGPLLASVSIHAALAILVALTMALALRSVAGACVVAVRALRSLALRPRSSRLCTRRQPRSSFLRHRRSARRAQRGPPAWAAF